MADRQVTCRTCGVQFTKAARGRTPAYCSRSCRLKDHGPKPRPCGRKPYLRREHRPAPCEGCGKNAPLYKWLCSTCMAAQKAIRKQFERRRNRGRAHLPPPLSRGKVEPRAIEHECFNCGGTFRPKRSHRNKFCGRDCGLEWTGFQAAVRKNGGRVSVSVPRKPCAACGKKHGNTGTYCGEKCRPPPYVRRTQAVCRNCGAEFDRRDDGATLYMCGDDCQDEARTRAKRAQRKKRRALERGAKVGVAIDPVAVFARDDWRCGICGRKTLKAKRGTIHPRAPELDHIVALANGGSHTWANVQCSCRECNGRKGASDFGQLLLFPAA
jgi:hypothetical protein